ncbi:hypothetical protein Tco_0200641 [Tanacetum coccineum]|uniref:Uncharacterized protein n=1 Tax=Tanacetum coccineum TaxID=301880 RepID=A0ABQ5ITS2_9ASTR
MNVPDSGSDLCIEESAPHLLCHELPSFEVSRAGLFGTNANPDSIGFFELWSSSFRGAEGPQASFIIPYQAFSVIFNLVCNYLIHGFSSAIKSFLSAWFNSSRSTLSDTCGAEKRDQFSNQEDLITPNKDKPSSDSSFLL